MDEITLNGIIKKLGSESFFEVSINKSQSVFKLKEKIQANFADSFPDISSAISIKLWVVRVSRNDSKIDQLKDTNATVENILGGIEMSSSLFVKDYFNNPKPSEIHIVAQGIPNWCTICYKGFENGNDLFKHEYSEYIHTTIRNIKNNDNILEGYEETVSVKKPTYRSKFEFDRKEDNNTINNSGENADSDD